MQRKVSAPLFALSYVVFEFVVSHVRNRHLKNVMSKVFIKHSRILCDRLVQAAKNGSSCPLYSFLTLVLPSDEYLDLQELMFRFTMDCFFKIGFGEDLHT